MINQDAQNIEQIVTGLLQVETAIAESLQGEGGLIAFRLFMNCSSAVQDSVSHAAYWNYEMVVPYISSDFLNINRATPYTTDELSVFEAACTAYKNASSDVQSAVRTEYLRRSRPSAAVSSGFSYSYSYHTESSSSYSSRSGWRHALYVESSSLGGLPNASRPQANMLHMFPAMPVLPAMPAHAMPALPAMPAHAMPALPAMPGFSLRQPSTSRKPKKF